MPKPFTFVCVLLVGLSACTTVRDGPPVAPLLGTVTAQDFFFYACVHAYLDLQGIPVFDGSTAYAVEYIEAPHEVLTRLHDAARAYASTIRSPDYSDPEHGLPPVLVRCREESQTKRVAALVREGMRQYAKRASS